MADKAFSNIAVNTKNSNKIYVYMGQCEHEEGVVITENNTKNLFKNLETMEEISIPVLDNKFIEENKIKVPNSFKNFEISYKSLRRKFFYI